MDDTMITIFIKTAYCTPALGKLDPDFVDSHGEYVDSVYFDVANEANFDSSEATGVFLPGT